jgi:hypothetical protein
MSCAQCAATHQRGRFCNRCGRQLPPAVAIVRRTPLVRRFRTRHEPTEPVVRERAVVAAARPADVRRMYDRAMERAAVHSRPSLQRYLAVLATP